MKLIRAGMLFLRAMIFRMITSLFPKKKNLWLFGAWKGEAYTDNSKYLFEYISDNKPDINAIWITKKEEVAELIGSKGYKVLIYPSIKAFWNISRAKVLFQTEGNRDIARFCPGRAKVIQLWHGVAAGKKVNWFNYSGLKKRIIYSIWADHEASYWMAASPKYIETHSNLFGVPHAQFRLTGTPREDAFYNMQESSLINKIRVEHPGCKIVAYMPTHRNFGIEDQLSDNIKRMIELDEYFGENKIVILFKPHPLEKKNCCKYKDICDNIYFAMDDEYNDVYSYIGQTDMLVSDYSSIVYDYLLTNKPIILYTYDIDNYRNMDGGISEIFIESPVGPFCETWEAVVSEIVKIQKSDNWKEARIKNRELFYSFSDGCNCERVYQEVKEILNWR